MRYMHMTDHELRRYLGVCPNDLVAVREAARRFEQFDPRALIENAAELASRVENLEGRVDELEEAETV
ncbi:MAG: hypothetical protein VB131_01205 [Burkholderia gladioli]